MVVSPFDAAVCQFPRLGVEQAGFGESTRGPCRRGCLVERVLGASSEIVANQDVLLAFSRFGLLSHYESRLFSGQRCASRWSNNGFYAKLGLAKVKSLFRPEVGEKLGR